MWKSNQTEADDALSCFKQNLEKRGKIQHALDDELIAQLPYHGKLMARRKNRFIVGAKGYENKKNALEIIQHIMAH
jgi:hypothetical protein